MNRYKHTVAYTYSEILLSHKKIIEVLINAKMWMNPENITLGEGSQKQKNTYRMIPFIQNIQNK